MERAASASTSSREDGGARQPWQARAFESYVWLMHAFRSGRVTVGCVALTCLGLACSRGGRQQTNVPIQYYPGGNNTAPTGTVAGAPAPGSPGAATTSPTPPAAGNLPAGSPNDPVI